MSCCISFDYLDLRKSMVPLTLSSVTLMSIVSHDQKSHLAPHINHLDLRNSMVPLMMPLASCDTKCQWHHMSKMSFYPSLKRLLYTFTVQVSWEREVYEAVEVYLKDGLEKAVNRWYCMFNVKYPRRQIPWSLYNSFTWKMVVKRTFISDNGGLCSIHSLFRSNKWVCLPCKDWFWTIGGCGGVERTDF